MRGEGQAEVSLRERRKVTPDGSCHSVSRLGIHVHRNKGGLVEVDGKSGGSREIIKELAQHDHSRDISFG